MRRKQQDVIKTTLTADADDIVIRSLVDSTTGEITCRTHAVFILGSSLKKRFRKEDIEKIFEGYIERCEPSMRQPLIDFT